MDGQEEYKNISISKDLKSNLLQLKEIFSDCYDIIYRELTVNLNGKPIDLLLVFTDGLVDAKKINESIIRPITNYNALKEVKLKSESISINTFKEIVSINEIAEVDNFQDAINAILSGDTVLLANNFTVGLILNSKGWVQRSVEEPAVESVIRGSREGLTENITQNVGLIRRKLKDPSLKSKQMLIGSRSQTIVSILYMDDLVNKQLLEEIITKLDDIEIDGIFESGYIEQLIEEHSYSPFPQTQVTERPDKVCGNLLEGKIKN